MITTEMIESNRLALKTFSQLIIEQLEALFGLIDLDDPDAARDQLLQLAPALAETYGPVSAEMGLEWYEQMLAASVVAETFEPVVPPLPDLAEMAMASVRYAAGHLWTPDPGMTLKVLSTKMDKIIKEPARQAIVYNADQENDAWWARVPTGNETCSFCLVLASRGADYHSKRSAGSREFGEENLFHGDCDCDVIRLGRFDEYPEGYLPEDIFNMYDESAKRVGRNDLKAVLHDFRRRFPELVKDGVFDDDYLSRIG